MGPEPHRTAGSWCFHVGNALFFSLVRPAPFKSSVPTERFPSIPRTVGWRGGDRVLRPGRHLSPSPKGEGGHVRRPLPPAALHTRPCLGFQPSALRWMFTGTQPEYASLLFIPDCTCCPHLTFKRTLQTADTHTQKQQATLADARGALSPTGFGSG